MCQHRTKKVQLHGVLKTSPIFQTRKTVNLAWPPASLKDYVWWHQTRMETWGGIEHPTVSAPTRLCHYIQNLKAVSKCNILGFEISMRFSAFSVNRSTILMLVSCEKATTTIFYTKASEKKTGKILPPPPFPFVYPLEESLPLPKILTPTFRSPGGGEGRRDFFMLFFGEAVHFLPRERMGGGGPGDRRTWTKMGVKNLLPPVLIRNYRFQM